MATLAPDFQRITDSLLDQIKTFDHRVASRSVGTVSAVYDGVALASGLGDVAATTVAVTAELAAGVGAGTVAEHAMTDALTVASPASSSSSWMAPPHCWVAPSERVVVNAESWAATR